MNPEKIGAERGYTILRHIADGGMGYALEYHLYHDGYGPTNVTLRDYLREHFPSMAANPVDLGPTLRPDSSASLIEQRADTVFGSRLDEKEPE